MDKKFDINEFTDACWKDVLIKINNAAVYIDHGATECLHWFNGDKAYLSLIDAGAHSVHEMALFNFQYVKVKGTKKVVFIITSPDSSFYKRTLKIIIDKNTFEDCTIVCAVHSTILKYSLNENDDDQYEMLKNDILSWMKNKSTDASVEIMFRPIFIAPITEQVFVTPPIERLMPPIDGKITDEYQSNADYFVSLFHSLFTQLNIKEDIYSIGQFSDYIADKLNNLPAAVDRKKMLIGRSGVSLIIIDRTLDLCTATKNNNECVLSRILSTLPSLPYHHNDVAVNMSPLCSDFQESPLTLTVPGCLATNDNDNFNILIKKKQKDVLLILNKWIVEILTSDIQSPQAKLSTRVTAHSLEKLVFKFRDNCNIKNLEKHSKKLQIIMAVIQSLKSDKSGKLDLLVSLEKLILQNLAVSRDSTSILSQISNIIKNRTSRGLEMEDLLVLLIYIYSISGTEIHFSTQQEQQLIASLENAIFEDIKKCNDSVSTHEVSVYQQTLLLLGVKTDTEAHELSINITKKIMNNLHLISEQRKNLHNYKDMIVKSNPQVMAECPGIVERLVNDLLDKTQPEIIDLQNKSSNLLSAGFNFMLKGRTTAHPTDNPWIIIYVLGGITPEEAKIVDQITTQSSTQIKITLAGCKLLNPIDVSDKILLSNIIL